MRRFSFSITSLTGLMVLGCATGRQEPVAGAAPSTPPPVERPLVNPPSVPADFAEAIEQGTRSPTGAPGSSYWQQWSDYRLNVRLDPAAKRVSGTAHITYHNRSPDSLPALAVHLHQNIFAPGAPRNRPVEVTGGVTLERVAAAGATLQAYATPREIAERPGYLVEGTVMWVRPPQTVMPGDSVGLDVAWSFTVPESGTGRMGWNAGNLFHIAYWYPQMAVYDDVVGWQTDPFLGNAEFYAGFGSYDLTVDAPEGWLVSATGRLENPEEVLTPAVIERLRRAEASDSVVHILTAADFGAGRATRMGQGGRLVWRFHADTVRDVAFSATTQSLWDAARTPVGDRDGDGQPDYARADALYRASAPLWTRAWRYTQHSIDFLSRWTGIPYPWPHMTSVEGSGIIGGGMEFPMMTLIGDYTQRGDTALYNVVAHELAHMWVPMIVATDERRYGWMDEGTTAFNENQARKEFFPGLDHDLDDQEGYIAAARAGREGEMMRWTDFHYPGLYGTASYSKPASALVALRGVLGEATFVRAYRTYLERWRFKHPKPWDFFNSIENVSGRDLDWFWRSWYYETWTLDQAVASVTSEGDSTRIVVRDVGEMPMPVRLAITTAGGEVIRQEIPVDRWLAGARTAEIAVPADAVTRVEIDPERMFPDVDRENNVWTGGGASGSR